MKTATALLLLALACIASAFNRTGINDDLPGFFEPGQKPGKFPAWGNPEGGPDPEFPRPRTFIDLFPPKWTPGDVLDATDHASVDKALSDVLKAGGIMNDRRCAVGASNTAESVLSNPRYYMSSGMIYSSPAFEIKQDETGLNLFVKKDWGLTGAVGVLTYDIDGTDHKLAIMFSVPYDWNLYDVWFNMKIYPQSYETGKHMFNQMYYYAGAWRAEGWETRREHGIELRGTMTRHIQSKLAGWIDTTEYDPEEPTELHHDCSYSAGWVGWYCWRECAKGYCWTATKCSTGSDCRGLGALPCYTSCKKAS